MNARPEGVETEEISMIKGYAGRILELDLENRQHEFKPLDEEIARFYIGGRGMGPDFSTTSPRPESTYFPRPTLSSSPRDH